MHVDIHCIYISTNVKCSTEMFAAKLPQTWLCMFVANLPQTHFRMKWSPYMIVANLPQTVCQKTNLHVKYEFAANLPQTFARSLRQVCSEFARTVCQKLYILLSLCSYREGTMHNRHKKTTTKSTDERFVVHVFVYIYI